MDALRDRFATLCYEQNPALKVSLSIGLAAFSASHSDATLWLKDADQALYEAKSTGRNRVMCCRSRLAGDGGLIADPSLADVPDLL
jgi:diguanylate cyclase